MPLSAQISITPFLSWTIITFLGNRTLLLTDAYGYLQANTIGGTQTVTIPPNADVAFEIGTQISFEQKNTAVLDITPGIGVTFESRDGFLIANGQFAVFSIVQDSLNVWSIFGDLA